MVDGIRTHGPGAESQIWAVVCNEKGAKTYLDGLRIQLEAFLLVGQELLDILTLISLKLNHLTHLSVRDDGAIAS